MTDEKRLFPSSVADKFVVRMPPDMRDTIAQRAMANNRSMNSEIVAILDEALSGELVPAKKLLTDPAVKKLIRAAIDLHDTKKPKR